ncbi:hypothetical protein HRW07_06995 [Streptomyces lunaelactis]|uniref:hypothetical protein n=1 Tax=Streptomyces lunaelactis TaxID=1535768 RepID=UPI001585A8D7|nr:hypothetical protein [Streptomyces lunaelactis]NUL02989.1 hypothetical protein [Streptomyces lunaelactis]
MASALRAKSFLVAAAFLAGTTLLTACQDDTTGQGSSSKTAAPAASAKVPAGSKGVSGTFAGGTVEYLAPGKYIVNANGKEQQFLTAEDTKVYGAGTICGKYNPAANTPCTVDDLEKVLKKGSIAADVVMKGGVATVVTERAAPDEGAPVDDSKDGSSAPAGGEDEGTIDGINKGKGVNGTWLGKVSYLAPGKFTVSDMKGTEQQFFLANDTEVWGYGVICGDDNTGEGGQGGTECTEEELEKAAKGSGLTAKVVILNGIATTITEDH